jgi:hypothetical protein
MIKIKSQRLGKRFQYRIDMLVAPRAPSFNVELHHGHGDTHVELSMDGGGE